MNSVDSQVRITNKQKMADNSTLQFQNNFCKRLKKGVQVAQALKWASKWDKMVKFMQVLVEFYRQL